MGWPTDPCRQEPPDNSYKAMSSNSHVQYSHVCMTFAVLQQRTCDVISCVGSSYQHQAVVDLFQLMMLSVDDVRPLKANLEHRSAVDVLEGVSVLDRQKVIAPTGAVDAKNIEGLVTVRCVGNEADALIRNFSEKITTPQQKHDHRARR